MQSSPFARRVLWHIVVLSVLLTCAIGGSGGADTGDAGPGGSACGGGCDDGGGDDFGGGGGSDGASGALMPTLCCLSEAANSPTKTIGSVSRQYFTFTDVDFYNLIIWKLVWKSSRCKMYAISWYHCIDICKLTFWLEESSLNCVRNVLAKFSRL